MSSNLPDFERPPVVEVAISLQFKPLELLRSAHFGFLWERFRLEGLPLTEDHGEIEPAFEEIETRGTPRIGVRLRAFDDAPPLPRVWFLNEAQNELVQVQRDRLIVNWRQGARSEPYPRYDSIRSRFSSALNVFSSFAASEKLGEIIPMQCEVTYVNHILAGEGWSTHADLDRVITMWENRYSESYLPRPEDAAFQTRFLMADEGGMPLGRLHVQLQSAYRSVDKHPIFELNLTARGAPQSADFAAAFRLFDQQHEWIVRGFACLTEKEMHSIWRRKNGSS
jgi:uncharacterized protein (TIGR04255 family)